MSYQVWTTEGYGFSISNALKGHEVESKTAWIKEGIKSMYEEGDNYLNESFPEEKGKIEGSTIDELENMFEEYENDFTPPGLEGLIADVCSFLWKKAGHEDNCVVIVNDDFGSDGTYWLLGTVWPWYQPEFKSKEECTNAMLEIFSPFITLKDIDTQRIVQGG